MYIIFNNPNPNPDSNPSMPDCINIVNISTRPVTHAPQCDTPVTPTLYVLNAAALSKPHALVHLAADMKSAGASVAVITETHFKQQHTDSAAVSYTHLTLPTIYSV